MANETNFRIQILGELSKASQAKIQSDINKIAKSAKIEIATDSKGAKETERVLSRNAENIKKVNKSASDWAVQTTKIRTGLGKVQTTQIAINKYTKEVLGLQRTEVVNNKEINNNTIKRLQLLTQIKATQAQNKALIGQKVIASKQELDATGKVVKQVDRYTDAKGKLTTVTRTYNAEANQMINTNTKITQGLDDAGKKGKFFSQNIGDAAKKFLEWTIISTLLFGTVRAIKAGVEAVTELNTALIELRKVTGLDSAGMTQFTKEASKMGETVAASTRDIVAASSDFARMGFSPKDALELGTMANMFVNIGDGIENVDEASKAIIATLKGFNMEASETMHILDAINEVSNNFSVDSAGLASGIQRVSASMSAANNTFEETLGLFTAVNEVVQNAERSSTGLRTIAMRMRGLDDAGKDLKDLVPKLQSQFSAIGITMTEANGAFKSTYDILGELAEQWAGLEDQQRAALTMSIAGVRRSEILEAALRNYGTALAATEAALDSEGSALKENAIAMESIESRTRLFQKAVDDLWINSINSGLITALIDLGTGFIKTVDFIGLGKVAVLGLSMVIASKLLPAVNFFTVAVGSSMAAVGAWNAVLGGMIALIAIVAVVAIDAMTTSLKEQQEIVGDLKSDIAKLQDEYDDLKDAENKTEEQGLYLTQLETELWLKQQILGLEDKELAKKELKGSFWEQVWENILKSSSQQLPSFAPEISAKDTAGSADKVNAYTREIEELSKQIDHLNHMYTPLTEHQKEVMDDSNIRKYNAKLEELNELEDERLILLGEASVVSDELADQSKRAGRTISEGMQENIDYIDELISKEYELAAAKSGDDDPVADDPVSDSDWFASLDVGDSGNMEYTNDLLAMRNSELTTQAEIMGYLKDNYAELTEEGFNFTQFLEDFGINLDLTNEEMEIYAQNLADNAENLEYLTSVQKDLNDELIESGDTANYAARNQKKLEKAGVDVQKVLTGELTLVQAVTRAQLQQQITHTKSRVGMLKADETYLGWSGTQWAAFYGFLGTAYGKSFQDFVAMNAAKSIDDANLLKAMSTNWAAFYELQIFQLQNLLAVAELDIDQTKANTLQSSIDGLKAINAQMTAFSPSTYTSGMDSLGGGAGGAADKVEDLNKELEKTKTFLEKLNIILNIRKHNLELIMDAKEKEIEQQKEANKLLEEEIALQKLQEEFVNAKKEKDVRIYTENGWEWIADPRTIRDLEEKISDQEGKIDEIKTEQAFEEKMSEMEAEIAAIGSMEDAFDLLDDEIKENIKTWEQLIDAMNRANIAFDGNAADIVQGLMDNPESLMTNADVNTADGISTDNIGTSSTGQDLSALSGMLAAFGTQSTGSDNGSVVYQFGDVSITADSPEDMISQLQQLADAGEGR